MKILALEFSSPQRSVAVVQGAPHTQNEVAEVIETGKRATGAFELIQTALQQAQLEREQIDCLAVGLGPGSYTGIRVAIALAQGWQLAREVKLLGISSAEGIAAQAASEDLRGPASVVIDAQRGEFYLASFELNSSGQRQLEALHLAQQTEVLERQSAGYLPIGPEVTNWFPLGRLIFPRAAVIGRLALWRNDFVPGEKLQPLYLRPTTFVKAPPPRSV
jgi:tRNA threonylcarbamoyl adenosine modification protein YeaZ